MKIEIKLSEVYQEPKVIICAAELTPEIQNIASLLEANNKLPITVKNEDTYHILSSEEIYMVRVEGGEVTLYTEKQQYQSSKRLYEIEQQLGKGFIKISKTTLVNLDQLSEVEPSFNGTMYLKLKNGCKDYISRKYLPAFKKYLGL